MLADDAKASTYGVHECAGDFTAVPDVAIFSTTRGYAQRNICPSIGAETRSLNGVNGGAYGSDTVAAPPGTRIERAWLDVTLAGVEGKGHAAQLFYKQVGGKQTTFGNPVSSGTISYSFDSGNLPFTGWNLGPLEYIGAAVSCSRPTNGLCGGASGSYSQIRNMGFLMRDTSPPEAPKVGGSLLSGWVRGIKTLSYSASDRGAGLDTAAATLAGDHAGFVDLADFCAPAKGSGGAVGSMSPCPAQRSRTTEVDVAKAPFAQGENPLRVCAAEYGDGPATTCSSATVHVDTVPPVAAFTSQQDPQDPDKLVAIVGDATSGVSAGAISYRSEGGGWVPLQTRVATDHLEARVDSAKLSPGVRYDFRAAAFDRAGNAKTTSLRADGSEMSVIGPLRTITDVTELRINGRSRTRTGYGKEAVLTGKVVGRDGSSVAGATVFVAEKFAPGSKRHGETLRAETKADGRFRVVVPPGPSRSLTAGYFGDRRYLGSSSGKVKLGVRAKVGLKVRPTVRAGGAVDFTGKLKARGARIPKAGKRLEVQVKVGPKWKTVGRSTTTNRKGSYRLHYRFLAQYVRPTRFTFRTVVARERSWPYLNATSHKRQVVVRP